MFVTWKNIALALAALIVAGLLAAWLGLFNVAASTGHWKVTEWLLGFAMRSSVSVYALGVEVPERLPREALQPAAAHFARGCAFCHGAPGAPRNAAALEMLPQPPDLSGAVGEWTDAQLYRIVKHGIRYTGMPAWPAEARGDEVWAMVAFLRELPKMSPGAYRGLAYGEAEMRPPTGGVPKIVADCARCHGDDGLGRSPATPIIAGQSEAYLAASLRAYLSGARPSGIMSLPVSTVDPDDIPALARFYARLPAAIGGTAMDDARKGGVIFRNGSRARNVPACQSCHGGDNRNPRYPRIAGQSPDYIAAQLRLFRAGVRGGTDRSQLMTAAAHGLADDEISALAAFLARR
ncbi:MAG: c-type cytochrome [Pseudomonadota bacterium]